MCGNLWKPPVRFTEVYNARKQGGILGLTVSRGGNSWKPLVRFPPSFQCRESRWNHQVDCFQVWKPSWNHIGVSPKWKLQETTDVMILSGFQRVSIFGKPPFFTQCLGNEIYNFGRTFLGHHYYKLNLSDSYPSVDK